MKKLTLLAALAVIMLASCNKTDYKSFVGTWGVERLEYYNIDYYGNPIAASMNYIDFDLNDPDNGIQLVFRENKTGEMRDSAVDTVWTDWNSETQQYESYIYNPDTTLVTTFTYTYDKSESALYMNMRYTYPYEYMRTFMMKVSDMDDDSFVYENEYDVNYLEKAYLKRLSDTPSKSAGRQALKRPHKPGALLGGR